MLKKSYIQKILCLLIPFALVASSLGLGVIQPTKVWASDAESSVSAVAISVSLTLSTSAAKPGDTVTASGTADANTFVSIKIIDSAQNIVFFDAIKSGSDGTYSATFKVPSLQGSTLTVVAGYGSNVATKTLIVNDGTILLTPPTLTADSSGNTVGSAVDLTFTDNTAWRAAITGITVDGTALTTSQYTATAGSLNIAAGVLTTAGNHVIVVRAKDYTDALVTQVTTAPTTGTVTLSSTTIDKTNKIATLTFSDAVLNNTTSLDELKNGITFAADGVNFNALLASDTVELKDKTLTITFGTALLGTKNKIMIAGNTLKDSSSKVLGDPITTGTINAFDECFIATAAFGSKNQTDVVLLRHFRDQFLLTNPLGQWSVQTYYHYSPPIAQFIAGNVLLKFVTRVLLLPFVAVVYMLFHPVLFISILGALVLLILQRRRRKAVLSAR